jgi:hypothetical protein
MPPARSGHLTGPPGQVEAAQLRRGVATDLPDEVRELMRLYPQPRDLRPSVEYITRPVPGPQPGARQAGTRDQTGQQGLIMGIDRSSDE